MPAKGPGRRFRKEVVAERRAKEAAMYRAGASMIEIAQATDVTPRMVEYDLKKLFHEWRSSAAMDIAEAKLNEIAKLNLVELEATQAWYRSIGNAKTITKHAETDATGTGKKYVTEKTEKLVGDPRFLDVIQRCVAKRCEILGLNAPLKVQGEMAPEVMSDSALERMILDTARQLQTGIASGNGNGNGHGPH